MLTPRDRQYYNIQGVVHKIGLFPTQLTDYYALIGDTADGVPGVPGVGPKTGVGLIKYYGSIENMLIALKLSSNKDKNIVPGWL